MAISLAPTDQLKGSIQNLQSSISVADQGANTILGMGYMGDPEFQTINQHIITAKENAMRWLGDYKPMLISTLEGVRDFGNEFNEAYANLLSLAKDIDKNPLNKTLFQQELLNLQADTQDHKAMVDVCNSRLKEYSESLENDSRNFLADSATIQNQIKADAADMQILHQQSQELEKKIKEKRELEIIFPFLGLADLIAKLVDSHNTCEAQYKELQQKYQSEQNELSVLYQVSYCLETLTGSSSMLYNSCLSLAQEWDTVSRNFSELIDSEDMIDLDSSWLVYMLETAKSDWDNLANQISGYFAQNAYVG